MPRDAPVEDGQHVSRTSHRRIDLSSRRLLLIPPSHSPPSHSPLTHFFPLFTVLRRHSHLFLGALLYLSSLVRPTEAEALAKSAAEHVPGYTSILKSSTSDQGKGFHSAEGHPGLDRMAMRETAEAASSGSRHEPEEAPSSLRFRSDKSPIPQPATFASSGAHTDRGAGADFRNNGDSEASIDPFSMGPYDVVSFHLPKAPQESGSGPPQPLLLFAPKLKGGAAEQDALGPESEGTAGRAVREAESTVRGGGSAGQEAKGTLGKGEGTEGEAEHALREPERTLGKTGGREGEPEGGLRDAESAVRATEVTVGEPEHALREAENAVGATEGGSRHADSPREGVNGGRVKGQQVARPSTAANASAPIVVFLHGFNLRARFYSQLLTHVASHGFIVVAPQLYTFSANPDASREIAAAGAVLLWLKAHLQSHLPDAHNLLPPDPTRVCIAGHSRGGKEAYGVALGLSGVSVSVQAVLVLDPVDGTNNTSQTPPPILQHKPDSLHLGAPVLVVGTGLGPLGKLGVLPPCAPAWVGHKFFYSDSCPPAYHVRAPEFGHMDLLDDETGGVAGKLTYVVCRNGRARAPMRGFCGGLSVAFLKGVLKDELPAFVDLLGSVKNFPILVDSIELKREESLVSAQYT